nr:reverse transcriptase domain-containing protein [Tanacetum cinerariifolium]
SRSDPTLLNDFEMAAEGNGNPPVPDLRTMEELYHPSLNGRVQNSCQFHELLSDDANKHLDKFLHVTQSIKVNGVTDDALRLYLFPHSLTHHATAWFDRLPRNSINTFEQMAKMFLGKYFPPSMATKLRNEITNVRQRLDESLFEAWEHYKLSIDRCLNHNMLLVTQIDTFYNGLTLRHRDTINAAAGGTFMKRRPGECYDLIENMTAHHNDWDTSAQRSESSSSITSSSNPKFVALKAEMAKINKNLMRVLQFNQQVKAVTPNCETCSGPHSYNDCPATVGPTQNIYDAGAYQGGNSYQPQGNNHGIPQANNQGRNQFFQGASHGPNPPPAYQASGYQAQMNTISSSGPGTLPSNTITNPKEDLKGFTIQSGTAYQGPTISTTSSSLPQVVERETEVTKDMVPPTNNGSTKDVQPPVVQVETLIPNYEPVVAPIIEPVVAPVSASKPHQKPSIPYPSRLHDQKLRDKANDQKEKFPNLPKLLPDHQNFVDQQRQTTSFLRTGRSLIDVFEGELKLRVGKEAITFNLDQTSRYSANYNDMTAKRIDVIDMPCEEYSHEVLGFFDVIASGTKNDKSSIDEPPEVELKDLPPHFKYVFLEGDDKFPVKIAKDLSDEEKTALIKVLKSYKRAIAWKLSDIKEKSHFMIKEGIVLDHKIFKNRMEVDKAKVDVIAKLPHPTTVKGIRSFLGYASFYRRFIQDFSKIARPMTHLLEKDTPLFFFKECVEAFQTLKKKLTEAPILIALDWDLPFELMCDSNDFVIGVVLGKRHEKYFRPIHYASKTMTEAESH